MDGGRGFRNTVACDKSLDLKHIGLQLVVQSIQTGSMMPAHCVTVTLDCG